MKTIRKICNTVFVIVVVAIGVLALADNVSAKNKGNYNKPGNVLISDQFNNRVIETDADGNIIWSFGRGPNDFSGQSIIGVNDAQRVGDFTLMAGTGTPSGVIPEAPAGPRRLVARWPKCCAKPALTESMCGRTNSQATNEHPEQEGESKCLSL